MVLRTIPRINGFTGDGCSPWTLPTFAQAALSSPRFAGASCPTSSTARRGAGPRRHPRRAHRQRRARPRVGHPCPRRQLRGALPRGRQDLRLHRFRSVETVMVVDQSMLLGLARPGSIDVLEAEVWSAEDADTVTRAARAAGLTVSLDATADEIRADHSTPRGQVMGDQLPPGVHGAGAGAGPARPRRAHSGGTASSASSRTGRWPISATPGVLSRGPRAPRCRSWPCWGGRGRSRGVRRHRLARHPARPGADPAAAPRGDRDRAAPGRRCGVRSRSARPDPGQCGRRPVAGQVPVRQRAAAR